MAHNHSHSHDRGHSHNHSEHDHSHDLEPALQSNLYSKIEFDNIITLNETNPKSGAMIIKKTWAERLSSLTLTSDADEQILMHVPFVGSVKLHSILIRASDSEFAPKTLKLFRNRDGLDFATASDLQPTQTLHVPRSEEIIELPVNRAHWNGTTSIDLFFEDNHSDGDEEETTVGYIGFKGEWTALNREAVSVLYEAAANPKDHVLMQGLDNQGHASLGR